MAVALVVGQALLCALIGWLTLGASRSDGGRSTGPIVDQLAAPPPAVPASAGPTTVPVATSAAAEPRKTVSRRPSSRPTATTTARERRSPSPPPRSAEPSREAAPPAPPSLINLPPPSPGVSAVPSPSGKVQEKVTVGDRCSPEGAFGRTEKGIEVRCLRSWHRGPRWKIA